ncbi:hypothetical protein [Terrimonas sp.]|nr:hypothetical protein [Terrimonas sp.]
MSRINFEQTPSTTCNIFSQWQQKNKEMLLLLLVFSTEGVG